MESTTQPFRPLKPRSPQLTTTILPLIIATITGCSGQPTWTEDEARAIEALHDIAQAQVSFQSGCYLDTDRDGIGDYGTLDMLADPDGHRGVPPFMNPLYTTERVGKYDLYITLHPGNGADTPPHWECYAFASDKGLRCFFVDTTGVVRFADRRETTNRHSPPVEQQTADA